MKIVSNYTTTMPERGELYLIAQRFSKHFPNGTRLINLECFEEQKFPDLKIECPVTIESVTTRGKNMFVHFTNNHSLHIHFGMSAGFRLNQHPRSKYKFTFENGEYYWFAVRTFACERVRYLPRRELPPLEGFDILLDDPTPDELWAARPKRGQNVASFLMKQGPFLGIGNYLRCMILYRTGIAPHRNTKSFSKEEFVSLFTMAREIVRSVIANGGHTVVDFLLDDEQPLPAFDVTPYKCKKDHEGNSVVRKQLTKTTALYWVPAVQK